MAKYLPYFKLESLPILILFNTNKLNNNLIYSFNSVLCYTKHIIIADYLEMLFCIKLKFSFFLKLVSLMYLFILKSAGGQPQSYK